MGFAALLGLVACFSARLLAKKDRVPEANKLPRRLCFVTQL
jgi:hypothetical protein